MDDKQYAINDFLGFLRPNIIYSKKDVLLAAKLEGRYIILPGCITGGPLFISRIGGLIDGRLGMWMSLIGTALLSAGLFLIIDLIMHKFEVLENAQNQNDESDRGN